MLRYLQTWIAQPRWQRLKPFDMLAGVPLDRLGDFEPLPDQGPHGVVDAPNGKINALPRRDYGYKDLRHLLS
jgi:hypothetical protein